MKYGHRRDTKGYGEALAQFDAQLKTFTEIIDDDTVIIITADHGCDPGFSGTDHTREYVPLFFYGAPVISNKTEFLTTYPSFSDLGATIADYFGINYSGAGRSFALTVFDF
jgi:phosphopentomutase